MIGRELAHYNVVEKLGSGGMGEVYLAEDTKLGRKVALKVLPEELAQSEERRARFEREARAIAALNHPNIVMVHSVEEEDGLHFITMELVRGKTLSQLRPRQGFDLAQFLDLAIPLADAVAATHEKGITHRDLKPENVMLSDDGRVKVLDFGLAKAEAGLTSNAGGTEAPTAAKTQEGRVVGTVHYMSPEQAEGKTIDARSDIFSLGVMFYEMLSGRRPFQGDTPASTLSAILKDSPPSLTELNPSLPRDIAKIVRRCLSKDVDRRIQSAKDLRNELEELRIELSSGELEGVALRGTGPGVSLKQAVVLALAAGAIGYLLSRRNVSIGDGNGIVLANPVQITSAVGVEDHPSWSADGRTLVYESNQSGNWDIWVSQLGGGEPVNRTADFESDDRFPTWSPDGSQIAFWSERDGGGYFVMPGIGGAPRKVSSPSGVPSRAQWSADGEELAFVVEDDSVEILTLRSRDTRRLVVPGSRGTRFDLSWPPDGRSFAYADSFPAAQVNALWVIRVGDSAAFQLTDGMSHARGPSWSEDRRTLFYVSNQGGTMDLWQQPMSANREPDGRPTPVSVGLGIRSVANFSPDGTKLAYARGRFRVANAWRVPILEQRAATWADAEQLTFDQAFVEYMDISSDGTTLLVNSDRTGNQDIWSLPSSGGPMTPLTDEPTPDWNPRFSPDDKEVAFYAYRTGRREIWTMPSSGGRARQVTKEGGGSSPTWSPSGGEIAFASDRTGNFNIWIAPLESGDPRQVTDRPGRNWFPSWSPDGERITFISDSGLGLVTLAEGAIELLSERAGLSDWSPDGRTVYFAASGEHDLRSVSLEDRTERRVTDLSARQGALGPGMATDGTYLYFTWQEDLGDIWVMDVSRQ